MLLTIGMIVKNEEKWLDRCLTAIKPILDNVDSELIVTDTGSTDRTVEIAKKYTDKVFYFEWINDFAAARNYALERAGGEWFMSLDADEIFRSCDNIIRFFSSGEYRSFNSAYFVINNLSGDNSSSYTFNASRLTKILPETKFEGLVHETMNTFGGKVKLLSDIADHYGYCYDTVQEKELKFERNSGLLLERLKTENPTSPMIYIQLYECYMLADRKAEAVKYMEEGIEYCKKTNLVALTGLYCRKAYELVRGNDYEGAIKVCDEYDRYCSGRTADKEMLAIRATSEFRLRRYSDAFGSLKSYFDIYDRVKNGELMTDDFDIVNFLASAESNYIPFVCVFLVCCIELGKCAEAAELVPELDIRRHIVSRQDPDSLVPLMKKILDNTGYDHADAFIGQLDEYGGNELRKAIGVKTRKNPEMEKLAAMLKSNVRAMISAGRYEDAEKYLSEYAKLVPDDDETDELREMIRRG